MKKYIEPLFSRMFLPLCVAATSRKYVVDTLADGHDVDCMACLVDATMADSKG